MSTPAFFSRWIQREQINFAFTLNIFNGTCIFKGAIKLAETLQQGEA